MDLVNGNGLYETKCGKWLINSVAVTYMYSQHQMISPSSMGGGGGEEGDYDPTYVSSCYICLVFYFVVLLLKCTYFKICVFHSCASYQ